MPTDILYKLFFDTVFEAWFCLNPKADWYQPRFLWAASCRLLQPINQSPALHFRKIFIRLFCFFKIILRRVVLLNWGFFFKDDFPYARIVILSTVILSACRRVFLPPTAIRNGYTNAAPYLQKSCRFRRRPSGSGPCRPSARRLIKIFFNQNHNPPVDGDLKITNLQPTF